MIKLVYFEPYCKGHRIDLVTKFIRYFLGKENEYEIQMLLHKDFEKILRDEQTPFNVKIVYRCYEIDESHPLRKGLAEYRGLRGIIKYYNPDKIFYNMLDQVLPFLFLFPFKSNLLYGMMYRYKGHYEQEFEYSGLCLKTRIIEKIKSFVIIKLLNKKKIMQCFMSDQYAVNYLNNKNISYIADPVPFTKSHRVFEKGKKKNKQFLMFGHLDERKGIHQLISALNILECNDNVYLVIAGESDSCFRGKLDIILSELSNDKIILKRKDGYIDNMQLEEEIMKCDLILAPYQDFPGSSGVLTLAAYFGKPVLTQQFGYIGKITRDYKLGFSLDTKNVVEIVTAIKTFIDEETCNEFEGEKARNIIKNATMESFVRTIMLRIGK